MSTLPPALAMQRTTHRTASILSVGDELILGQSLDTHARWLSDQLTSLGVRVIEHVTVDDDLVRVIASIERLCAQSDLLLVTGGLGPTADDLTRDALAEVLGEDLVEDARALSELLEWFSGRGRTMPERNRVQALRPVSARCLANPNGTAPGLASRVLIDGHVCDVYCMPGPPREMYPMFKAYVARVIEPDPGRTVQTRVLRTFGWGESSVAQSLGGFMERDRNPVIGTTASQGIVSVRLRYEGAAAPDEARKLLDEDERRVRDLLGSIVLGREDELGDSPLVAATSAILRHRGETLASVESCTGGGIGAAMTSMPGSSDVYVGGMVTYSNRLKTELAGVEAQLIEEHGAVSAEVARAMAEGGRERLHADHCLAVTGIAGPEGGSDDKPVGTVWIARASAQPGGTEARLFRFKGGRAAVREWAATAAIGMLRQHLMGIAGEVLLGEVTSNRASSR